MQEEGIPYSRCSDMLGGPKNPDNHDFAYQDLAFYPRIRISIEEIT